MNIFTFIGDIVIRLFNFVGMIILAIPKIPDKLRSIDTDSIKDRVDSQALKENISKIKNDTNIEERISGISKSEIAGKFRTSGNKEIYNHDIQISSNFTSKEKEDTILKLQILSGGFIVVSIIYLFNFIHPIVYGILGVLLIGYTLYLLFNKIKLMYAHDFNAYRDFFLMYIAVGIILVLVGTNENFVMAFSFQFFPSLTILIFSLISVAAVFLIFRMKYYRNYTFGTVIETGENTAHVKVEYDIRSNVKPDIYIVEDSYGSKVGETVKIRTEEKMFSNSGNKPIMIIK